MARLHRIYRIFRQGDYRHACAVQQRSAVGEIKVQRIVVKSAFARGVG